MGTELDVSTICFALALVRLPRRAALTATTGDDPGQKEAAATAIAAEIVEYLRRSYAFTRKGVVAEDGEIAEHLAHTLRHLPPEIAEHYAGTDAVGRETAGKLIGAMLAGTLNVRFEIDRSQSKRRP